MPDKKLFHVTTTIEIDMVVLAEDEEEANAIGALSWQSEIDEYEIDPDDFSSTVITKRKQIDWIEDEDLDSTCPYDGDEEETTEAASIQEHLDDLGIK